MATALPRPRPSMGPDTSLPTLSVPKSRKSVAAIPSPTKTPNALRSGLRAPSSASPPTPSNNSVPPLPKGSQSAAAATKTIRKTVSINSFPKPPKGDNRLSSMPSSPLARPARKPKPARDSVASSIAPTPTPSPFNGGAEGKFINSLRMSDGVISVSSPPHSRSSSAQGSYSTSATTYEDSADASGSASEKRASAAEAKGNVLVSVRVRPDSTNDNHADGEWMVDGRRSLIGYKGKEGGDYYYDNVFTTHDNNARVYDHIAKRLVRRVMEGYHGTVFAYGQTGTGKTFSMQGTTSSPGVIPLAITDIFSYIRETPSREFLLRVSYLEIYNEKIHDLLSMASANGAAAPQEEIKLREDSKRGVYATPLKEEIVQSPTQLLRVIARGDQARRTASTQFNARSSRSHAVVQIIVESRERMPGGGAKDGADNKRSGILPGGVRVSTLSLIDLAGSEKAAESKERRQEGAHINKSLLTLGTVIAKLSEWKDKGGDKEGKHLPYRDSKLTRLLQGALSGNSLVSILCTAALGATGSAATTANHTIETLNTLKFASRAKNSIVSHAKRAEEALGQGGDGGARVLLERYRMEIQELKQQLETQASKKNDEDIKEIVEEDRVREREMAERHEEQILEMQLARTALKERIDHLNRLILSSKSAGVNSNGTMSALARYSQISLAPGSARSSVALSIRSPLERTASVASTSTIGRRSSYGTKRLSGEADVVDVEEDSVGENGDGMASLAAQNRALQADIADKNRYISTLEKRLLQARRASSSRTSSGFSAPTKGIMVGEDHSVAALLKEKDAEIADLRARLDDKDRMLAALRSAARSRDNADAMTEPRSPQSQDGIRTGLPWSPLARESKRRTKSIDEMNNMLEEMIQDRVETGHIIRGVRGSVRLAPSHRLESLGEPPSELPPLRRIPTPVGERSAPVEAAS
ncbi:centromeric e [Trichoderma cornu-damae]|uniref:Kinesin-like protein n=1 Tax=Trichoderma cornu-damae TaxID=654480 RepID=A0A9P8QP31_9HYPO|nr:centromeric e [Trichoderma cornu-damae]